MQTTAGDVPMESWARCTIDSPSRSAIAVIQSWRLPWANFGRADTDAEAAPVGGAYIASG